MSKEDNNFGGILLAIIAFILSIGWQVLIAALVIALAIKLLS
jgi:hypothetical protein